MPKSRSLTSPSCVTSTFDGFRSRCTTRFRCAAATASQQSCRRPQPLVDREIAGPAVVGDRLAFDELHDEVRPPVLGRAAVEKPRDVRMLEPREDPPLAREALEDLVRGHARAQELDGDALLEEAVGPLGEQHLAHPAAAEAPEHAVRADALGRRRLRLRSRRARRRALPRRPRPASRESGRPANLRRGASRPDAASSASPSAASRRSRSAGASSTSSSKSARTSVQRPPALTTRIPAPRAPGRERPGPPASGA